MRPPLSKTDQEGEQVVHQQPSAENNDLKSAEAKPTDVQMKGDNSQAPAFEEVKTDNSSSEDNENQESFSPSAEQYDA